MGQQQLLISVSAFSGLLGALLTQLMTGLFSYVNDKRKQKIDLQKQFRDKKLEIGESFYFINGELMTMIQKNITYWKNLHGERSEASRNFMNKEMEKLDAYQAKLNTENWKYNLIGIYFDVPFTFNEIQESNRRSHQLYLKVIDLSEKIKRATAEHLDELYQNYHLTIFDLCSHYEKVYSHMQDNMVAIKVQLLGSFNIDGYH